MNGRSIILPTASVPLLLLLFVAGDLGFDTASGAFCDAFVAERRPCLASPAAAAAAAAAAAVDESVPSLPPTDTALRMTTRSDTTNGTHTTSAAAPLYITVGPQCAGKTTELRRIAERERKGDGRSPDDRISVVHKRLVDIALDDQPDVYVPVPTSLFLEIHNRSLLVSDRGDPDRDCHDDKEGGDVVVGHPSGSPSSAANQRASTYIETHRSVLERTIHGRSVADRIRDIGNTEQFYLLQLWNRRMSVSDFQTAMQEHYGKTGEQNRHPFPFVDHATVAAILIQAAIDIGDTLVERDRRRGRSQPTSLTGPEHVKLFCAESLFRKHPDLGQSGIDCALAKLRRAPLSTPVAWGNTNSRPRDYEQALTVASQQRRPVRFLIMLDNDLSTLLKRNCRRFLETGKYVPAIVIAQTMEQCNRLCQGLIDDNVEEGGDERAAELLVSKSGRPGQFLRLPNGTVRNLHSDSSSD